MAFFLAVHVPDFTLTAVDSLHSLVNRIWTLLGYIHGMRSRKDVRGASRPVVVFVVQILDELVVVNQLDLAVEGAHKPLIHPRMVRVERINRCIEHHPKAVVVIANRNIAGEELWQCWKRVRRLRDRSANP
jgi:hypothetical protein